MQCLRRILGLRWQDNISNNDVLEMANITTVFFMLRLRRLRWLGHTKRMKNGRIPKNLIYGEFKMGKRSRGRLLLRYTDVCKLDMQDTNIDLVAWEQEAIDRVAWRGKIRNEIVVKYKMIADRSETKCVKRHTMQEDPGTARLPCTRCNIHFSAQNGIASHLRHHYGM
jgi:hypothetical protein